MARGIYLTAYTAGGAYGLDLIRRWNDAGGNTVVFDVKDFDGELHVPFKHAYAPPGNITIRNLPKFIHYVHSFQMHAIARIALFRDAHLAQTYPDLAVHSRASGKPWLENGKLVWADPSNPAVQDYNLDLARFAAGAGADEIQFDYVRFPPRASRRTRSSLFKRSIRTGPARRLSLTLSPALRTPCIRWACWSRSMCSASWPGRGRLTWPTPARTSMTSHATATFSRP